MGKFISRVYYTLGWVAILLSITVMLTGVWWIVAPREGLVAISTPALTVTEQVLSPSSVLQLTFGYCVDESLPLPVTVDSVLEFQSPEGEEAEWPVAPPIAYQITERCETRIRLMGIPSFARAGVYHVHSTTSLQVNPLRQIKQSWQSNDFEIIANPPPR